MDLALEKKYGNKMEFIIANVTTEEGNYLAGLYRVDLIPAFFLIDRKGNVVFSDVGVQSEDKLDRQISEIIGE